MTLNNLIKKHGEPDALIDHWDKTSKSFAIWGLEESFLIDFEGKAFYNKSYIPGEMFEIFQNVLDSWKNNKAQVSAIGYISYDIKNFLYPSIKFKKINKSYPLLWFAKPKRVISYTPTINKKNNTIPYIKQIKDIPSKEEYKRSIDLIKSFLKKGESYQINFTNPKQYLINKKAFETYFSLSNIIKPHYGMYLNCGSFQILSFSPERFFKTSNHYIESYPMKGTRPRSNNKLYDKILVQELLNSQKDLSEHLMIVDLIRNDIGKICEYGSVSAKNLFEIKSFETIHQMVSTIKGKLSLNINETQILKALFPGGSITGAPKERSMKIIDDLENYQRNIYTGSLGYILPNGNMDFNIAIRTMTLDKNKATYPVGGGIVWDSNYIEEWKEAQHKSRILELSNKLSKKINNDLLIYN